MAVRPTLALGRRAGGLLQHQVALSSTSTSKFTLEQPKEVLSAKSLENRLRERIHTRELGIPVHHLNVDASLSVGEHEGTELAMVPPDDLRRRKVMSDYMIKNFYVHAPVPKHIQLLRTLNTNGLLKAELDLLTGTGMSQILTDKASGKIASVCLNMAWRADSDYDAFPVKAVDWLNTGARIAEETGRTEEDVIAAWRSFQWQHIHHAFVGEARRRGFPTATYFGMAYNEPEFQGKKLGLLIMSWGHRVAKKHGALTCFVLTIPNMFETIRKHKLDEYLDVLEYVPYTDLSLKIDGKKNVFEPLNDAGGLVFLCAKQR